jgi:hypothetical protein
MADGYIQVAPDSTGKKMETSALIQPDASIVHRERVTIGDNDGEFVIHTKLLTEINENLRLIRDYIRGTIG